MVGVAQLVRALDCDSRGRGFESPHPPSITQGFLACGLKTIGFERGDKLAIIGDNRPCLYWAMVASQCLGGTPVPLYQDSVAEEMKFVLANAEVRFAVVENQEQTDKVIEILKDCPKLEYLIYEDSRGMRKYSQQYLHSFGKVQKLGEEFHRDHPNFFRELSTFKFIDFKEQG